MVVISVAHINIINKESGEDFVSLIGEVCDVCLVESMNMQFLGSLRSGKITV